MLRRSMTVIAMALALLMLSSSAALAHFCYRASASPQGVSKSTTNSPVYVTMSEFVGMFLDEIGLCEDGREYVLAELAASPYADYAIQMRATMAAGRLARHPHLSLNGRGVDHLSPDAEVWFFGVLDEAAGLCTNGS